MTNISSGYSGLVSRVLPLMPVDGSMVFEFIMFAFVCTALLLQYLHLYRSVWWLPHSYNNNAMNFYLVDPVLIVFSVSILSRRMLWTMIKKILNKSLPSNWTQSFIIVFRSMMTMSVLLSLLVMVYVIVQKHHLVNILYLVYP